jgi:AraC family transcriptional regulator of adaptative response / DNA-3-methyladenine glycosylase II
MMRKQSRAIGSTSGEHEVRLDYRPPFDWRSMLEFFSRRAIPGIEFVDADSYHRSFTLQQKAGHFAVQFSPTEYSAVLTVNYPDANQLGHITDRVCRLFDFDADSTRIAEELAADPQLAPIVTQFPGLRVPGCWDGLEIAVRAIVGQQVSVKAAATLMRRLVDRAGHDFQAAAQQTGGNIGRIFPSARQLTAADLSGLGIIGRRIEAIQALAEASAGQRLRFDGSQTTESFCREACRIKGVGDWTAQYIALRVLRDPDAFPHGDLILQRALAPEGQTLTAKQLLEIAEQWRPWRAYAVMLLWRHHQQRRAAMAAD